MHRHGKFTVRRIYFAIKFLHRIIFDRKNELMYFVPNSDCYFHYINILLLYPPMLLSYQHRFRFFIVIIDTRRNFTRFCNEQ